MTANQLAAVLGRSDYAVRRAARALGYAPSGRYFDLDAEQVKAIRAYLEAEEDQFGALGGRAVKLEECEACPRKDCYYHTHKGVCSWCARADSADGVWVSVFFELAAEEAQRVARVGRKGEGVQYKLGVGVVA